MTATSGVRLDISGDRPPLTGLANLAEINTALAQAGAGVWPLDLSGAPRDIKNLLARPELSEVEKKRVLDHFLLPRGRLLEIVAAAGRQPNVTAGGDLTTLVSNQGYAYPELWVVQGEVDYTRFDRFHVNASEDGVGVDEVLQMLSGKGVVIRLRLPDGDDLALGLDCPGDDTGWLVTYDGGRPHIGSLSGATTGTKLVVQAIGPARWSLDYVTP